MTVAATIDPVLETFTTAVRRAYGDRVERIVLFGSRARGDAREDSDYDIAVFLENFENRWAEVDRLVKIELDIMDDAGAFIHSMPYAAGSWTDRTPLMHEIRREGRDL